MKHSFLLGTNRDLSLLEIESVFGRNIEETETHCILESEKILTQKDLNRLGGSVNIGQIFTETKSIQDTIENCANEIANSMNSDKKIIFAINIHPVTGKFKKLLKSLLIGVKKQIVKDGYKCRFLNKIIPEGAKNIENIQVKKEILENENTICLELIENNGGFLCSKLLASQDIENYAKRDFGKPFRDAKNGMMPPKLCQIMINFAVGEFTKNTTTITDPFCGNGGILLEALLMGLSVNGSDISETMVEESRQNIEWLKAAFHISDGCKAEVIEHDAREKIPFKNCEYIVAEGYLGPPMKAYPNESTKNENFSELMTLYVEFFKNVKRMKELKKVVIAIPCYLNPNIVEKEKRMKKVETLPIQQEIEKIGFHLAIQPIIYARSDQIVGRQIYVLST